MDKNIEHSWQYERLSEQQKEKADAIIGFLSGENTRSVEQILLALTDEIKHHSEIKG